jgi:CPA2 family monovalent cation:H+ antiporter-2
VTSPINIDSYSDALVLLGTAGIVVPLIRRWGLNPILGYLGAGAILGPLGLGSFTKSFSFLYWFTITDAQSVAAIAELGVVFLLFLIGLELSFKRLVTMRRLVFGLGGLQVLLTASLLSAIAAALGQNTAVAIIVGTSLALSSTAIVLEILSDQGRLNTGAGRASFSVLLAQDLAVIPLLLFISVLALGTNASVMGSLTSALLRAAIAITLIVVFGRLLLRPLFRLVAGTHSTELFVAAGLFVVVAAGLIAHQANLSMALGAFIAGLVLAETEYGKAIETVIEPFKGLLLGMFFFTVGMNVDLREFLRQPILLAATVVCLILVKSIILTGLGRLFRLSWRSSIESGLLIGPGGEFAFVGIGTAATLGLIEPHVTSFTLALTAITMVLTPLLSTGARKLTSAIGPPRAVDPDLTVQPPSGEKHAIVVGYGRIGKVVCSLLEEHGINYIAIDHDASGVARDRRDGHAVYYGDASDLKFLEKCGLRKATGVVITVHSQPVIDKVVDGVRSIRPDVLIVSRARDADHARHLYAIGATDAVPETIEASLQLSEAALVGLGIATGRAIASVHEKRDEFRRALQQAARAMGREDSHSVRPKTHGRTGKDQ